MAGGIMGISLSGLNAALGAMNTVQHNIANANTPGFHRQEVQFSSNRPVFSGAGFFGNGVNIATVRRLYDQFLDNELMRSQGQLARYQAYAAYASQVDQLLGNQNSGINTALDAFFSAVNEVANDPTSTAARQTMLSAASNLQGRMNSLGGTLDGMLDSINQEIASIAGQVNSYVTRIADLNLQITAMEAGGGNPANDLRDQRDQLTSEINKLINVTVLTGADGSYNLYIGSGQPLLVGAQASGLTAAADPYDPSLRNPAISLGGYTLQLGSDLISGGRLGGLLAMREDVILPALQDLGQMAIGLAGQFNDLHSAGYDLNGATGWDFFTVPGLRAPSAATSNAGTAQFTLDLYDPQFLRRDDYTLSYDGSNYQLIRASDGTTYTAANLAGLNALVEPAEGFTLTLASGAIAAGDRFEIRNHMADGATSFRLDSDVAGFPERIAVSATAAGVPGDNSNALALAALQTQKTLGGNPALYTYSELYTQIVSRTANLASEADIGAQAYDSLTQQAFDNQQAVSGVNLDEEAANLLRFQQAYQASARALDIASSLLDEILAIAR